MTVQVHEAPNHISTQQAVFNFYVNITVGGKKVFKNRGWMTTQDSRVLHHQDPYKNQKANNILNNIQMKWVLIIVETLVLGADN